MFQKKNFFYIILALVFVSLFVWAFLVYRDRSKEYESNTSESTEIQQLNEENTDPQTSEESNDSETTDTTDSGENDLNDEEEDEENVAEEKTSYDEITSKDCANECKDFKNNSKDLKYCQQVCGLTPIKEETKKGTCDSLSDLEKDYCLKDLAVDKGDFKICDEIEDAGIQKTCRNRITEDILN